MLVSETAVESVTETPGHPQDNHPAGAQHQGPVAADCYLYFLDQRKFVAQSPDHKLGVLASSVGRCTIVRQMIGDMR